MRRSTLYLTAQRLAPLTFVVGAVACTPMLSGPPDFNIRPVSTQPSADLPSDQGHYQNAVDAIKQRDYGVALNFLQAARAEEKDSARVLNAFGVVYDKLGRFDLSARYYEKARAADPQSTIVAGNIAYSHVLQQLLNGDITPRQLAAAVPAPKPPVVVETQTIVAPDVELKSPQLAMTPIATPSTPSLSPLSLPDLNLAADTSDTPAGTKAPQLAMALIQTPSAPSLAALPLPDLSPATDTSDKPAETKVPQLAMAPIQTPSAPSLAALRLPDLNLATDTSDKPAETTVPQLAMVPIETRTTLSLTATPLSNFDLGTDMSDRSVAPQLAPVTATQLASAKIAVPQVAAAPPPGLLVVDTPSRGSNVLAPKPVAPKLFADLGLLAQQTRREPQQAMPSEYLPLFLPERSKTAAPRTEVEKIEDVPQYRAQLAAGFSTEHPEKRVARATVASLAAAHPEVRKQPLPVQVAASRTPAHAAVATVTPAQHSIAVAGSTARVAANANTGILTHHPLVIVNASTKKNADDSIRFTLARRNWSIAPSHGTELHKLTYTTVFYAQVDYPVARALARTLTFPVRLVPDSCCSGLRLVVGDNALHTAARDELHGTASTRAGSSVAGVLSSTLQGARGW